jgi:hypothetical protein
MKGSHLLNVRDRELRMDRAISRRDFLNGVDIAIPGSLVAPPWSGAFGRDVQSIAPEQSPD